MENKGRVPLEDLGNWWQVLQEEDGKGNDVYTPVETLGVNSCGRFHASCQFNFKVVLN